MSPDTMQNTILESGVIYQRTTNEPHTYVMLRLDRSYLSQMMRLQELILAHLSHPHMLQPFTEDFMCLHLEEKGFSLGVVVDGRLVAFRNTYFPDRDEPEWNLGPDLKLDPCFHHLLVNLQFSCVHPDFRGNDLGYLMMRRALQRIRSLGKYHFCCATVSPLNYWSVNILLRNGFAIYNLKTKYCGKLRYLLCQDLRKTMDTKKITTMETVGLTDFNLQKELFAQGLCAVGIRKIPGIHSLPRTLLAKGYELVFTRKPLL